MITVAAMATVVRLVVPSLLDLTANDTGGKSQQDSKKLHDGIYEDV
jgi:hypothetical protein